MIKAIVGDGAGGLVHNIWLDITPEETCLFMTRAQRMINAFLIMFGFTMSCSDIVPDQETTDEIQKILKNTEKIEKELL